MQYYSCENKIKQTFAGPDRWLVSQSREIPKDVYKLHLQGKLTFYAQDEDLHVNWVCTLLSKSKLSGFISL